MSRSEDFKLPPSFSSPELNEIWELANTFDGYEESGMELGNMANSIMKTWYEHRFLPHDFRLVEACLFYESRRARFIEGHLTEENMPYLKALQSFIIKSPK